LAVLLLRQLFIILAGIFSDLHIKKVLNLGGRKIVYFEMTLTCLHVQKPWHFSVDNPRWNVGHKTVPATWLSSTQSASWWWSHLRYMHRCLHEPRFKIWCHWSSM